MKLLIIDIDLSRQTNTCIPQQLSFTKKIKQGWFCNNVFVSEKQHQTIQNFP